MKKERKYAILILCFLLVQFSSAFSQVLGTSDVEREKVIVRKVLVSGEEQFFVVAHQWVGAKDVHFLKRYSGLHLQHTAKLSAVLNDRLIDYKAFGLINDTVSAFFCITDEESFSYYLQQYDTLCTAIGEPRLLTTIPRLSNRKWDNGGVVVSRDHNGYVVFCEGRDKAADARSFHYARFSESNQLITEGTIMGSKSLKDVNFEDVWLTSDEKVVVSESVLLKKLWSERRSNRRMDVIRIHVIDEKSQHVITLVPPQNEYLTQVECVFDGNSIHGQGIYCQDNDHFHGLFAFEANAEADAEVVVSVLPRTQSVELTGFDLRYSNRKKNPVKSRSYTCNEMKLLGTFAYGDSTVFAWERFVRIVHKSTETLMGKDILIATQYKDSLLNCTVIPKSSVSYNDNGINLTAFALKDSDHTLRIYFNDYMDLYNSSGIYEPQPSQLERNRIWREPFGVAEVQYNLTSHQLDRHLVFDATVFDLPAAPVFWLPINNDELLLQFVSYANYRFAYWKFR